MKEETLSKQLVFPLIFPYSYQIDSSYFLCITLVALYTSYLCWGMTLSFALWYRFKQIELHLNRKKCLTFAGKHILPNHEDWHLSTPKKWTVQIYSQDLPRDHILVRVIIMRFHQMWLLHVSFKNILKIHFKHSQYLVFVNRCQF